jgi:hypothetical protein
MFLKQDPNRNHSDLLMEITVCESHRDGPLIQVFEELICSKYQAHAIGRRQNN